MEGGEVTLIEEKEKADYDCRANQEVQQEFERGR